jgi:hypothetical protein
VDFFFLLWMYFVPQALENLLALNILATGLNGTVISWIIIWLLSAVCFVTATLLLMKKRKTQVRH